MPFSAGSRFIARMLITAAGFALVAAPRTTSTEARRIPMLDDFAAMKPEEMEVLHSDRLAGWGHAEQLAARGPFRRMPHRDHITLGDEILNRCVKVGQRSADRRHEVRKARWPVLLSGHLLVAAVDEVRGEYMLSNVEIALIEHALDDKPHERLVVIFAGHWGDTFLEPTG